MKAFLILCIITIVSVALITFGGMIGMVLTIGFWLFVAYSTSGNNDGNISDRGPGP